MVKEQKENGEEKAIKTVYDGLAGPESVPVKLRLGKGLDKKMFSDVTKSLTFLIEQWKGKKEVPKAIAAAFVDIQGAMMQGYDTYPPKEQDAIEDAANTLVELALTLLEE